MYIKRRFGSLADHCWQTEQQGPSDSLVCSSMAFRDGRDYFYPYGFLTDQRLMLEDEARMSGYHTAIRDNAATHFEGKVVLDCGTGTGILAVWAAKAGARHVYAVEATKMAQHARTLVQANGLSDTVSVIEGKIEDITLPEKVSVST